VTQKRSPITTSCLHGVVCNHYVVCTLWQSGTLEPNGTRATVGSGVYDRNGMCKYAKHGVCDYYESQEVINVEATDGVLRETV
jgi:hypothetical protein